MNSLKTFNNSEFGQIRTIEENGKIYFCGKDVATALGYAIPRKAIKDHCKGVLKWNTPTSSGIQLMSFITKGDLYRLIVHSKLPKAEEFEQWVFDEILPTIRQTGQYSLTPTNDTITPMLTPDAKDYLTAARLVSQCPNNRLALVLSILKRGGFDVSLVQNEANSLDTSNMSDIITETMERTGYSCKKIGEIIGIDGNRLTAYRRKERRPSPEKYQELVTALSLL